AFCTFVPQRLRRSSCNCRIDKSPRSSKRDGMDLVGRSYQLFQSRKSKTAARKASRRNRQSGILSGVCSQTRAPETTPFDELPGNECRNPEADFARSRDQCQGESAFARNAEQISNHKITAFLHSQTGRNCKRCR